MEIFKNTYELDNLSYAIDKYFDKTTLFFDIECTGLSPRKSFIYLIGYATRSENTVTITANSNITETVDSIVINCYQQTIENLPINATFDVNVPMNLIIAIENDFYSLSNYSASNAEWLEQSHISYILWVKLSTNDFFE